MPTLVAVPPLKKTTSNGGEDRPACNGTRPDDDDDYSATMTDSMVAETLQLQQAMTENATNEVETEALVVAGRAYAAARDYDDSAASIPTQRILCKPIYNWRYNSVLQHSMTDDACSIEKNHDETTMTLDHSVNLLDTTVTKPTNTHTPGRDSLLDSPLLSDITNRRLGLHPSRRTLGPNEVLYTTRYASYVTARLQAFEHHCPGRLPRYATLSPDEQAREQQRVQSLLQRLQGLSVSQTSLAAASSSAGREIVMAVAAAASAVSSSWPTSKNRASVDLLAENNDDSSMTMDDAEVAYHLRCNHHSNANAHLSPPLLQPLPRQDSDDDDDDDNVQLLAPHNASDEYDAYPMPDQNDASFDSTQSIEVTRGATQNACQSPDQVITERKRVASRSGKRGQDLVRRRPNSRSSNSCSSSDASVIALLQRSVKKLSLDGVLPPSPDFDSGRSPIFSASQSPITPHLTHSPLRRRDGSSSSDDDDDSSRLRPIGGLSDDEASSVDDSLAPATRSDLQIARDRNADDTSRRRVHWNVVQPGDAFATVSGNVALKPGAPYHLPPLKTRPHGAPPQPVQDPLDKYEEGDRVRLRAMSKWMLRREQQHGAGALFGLDQMAIIALCARSVLKTLSVSAHSKTSSKLSGHHQHASTLIVLRDQDCLEEWKRAMCEQTGGRSVLNHSRLPVKDRKSVNTLDKCALYDIVLTTYDALKSPDTVVALDECGIAVVGPTGSQDGWLTGRRAGGGIAGAGSTSSAAAAPDDDHQSCSGSSFKTLQLSILHRLSWQRVIYQDTLGRKCYLAKLGTSRSVAARVLRTKARFAFFLNKDDQERGLLGLRQSDKGARKAVSALLQVDELALDDHALDFEDVEVKSSSSSRCS